MRYLKGAASVEWKFRPLAALVSSAGISQIIAFIGTIAIARLYSPSEFGSYSLIVATAGILAPVMTFSYESFIVPAKNERIASKIRSHGLYLVARNCIWIVCILIVNNELAIFPVMNTLSTLQGVLICIILAGIYGSYSILSQSLLRQRKFSQLAIRGPLQNFSISSVQILSSYSIVRDLGLIVGELFGRFVGVIYLASNRLHGSAIRLRKINLRVEIRRWHAIANFMSITFEIIAGYILVFYVDHLFGRAIAGEIAMTQRILGLPVVLFGATTAQYFLASNSNSLRHGNSMSRVELDRILRILGGFSIGLCGLIIIFASPILSMVIGGRYTETIDLVRVLSPFLIISLIWNPISSIFYTREMWSAFFLVSFLRILFMSIGAFVSAFQNFGFYNAILIIMSANAITSIGALLYIRNKHE